MKVLWINPSFLDYRIPLYSNLYHLLDKNFYLLFSQKRNPERVNNKIQLALGEKKKKKKKKKKKFPIKKIYTSE